MLKKLYLKNYAIFEEIEVEFGSGLNILTGETGAGKSILIGALSLLLGERADIDFIRKGEKKAVVEGIFNIKENEKIKNILKREKIEPYNYELILRREVSNTGRNRAFINDSAVTISTLKEISKYLIDIHGQHQHQSLFYNNSYSNIIDEYGGIKNLTESTINSYLRLNKLKNNYNELLKRKKELKEQEEFFRYQLEEINKVNPVINEDEALEREILILENMEKIREYVNICFNFLYEGEGSAAEKIKNSMKYIEELEKIDPQITSYLKDLESAYITVKETGNYIRDFGEKVEYSQEHLENLRERLLALNSLKRKFKGTIKDILNKKTELESK
ncbi:DNA repair protein RecN, partial [candidate division KSB1 bacterium]